MRLGFIIVIVLALAFALLLTLQRKSNIVGGYYVTNYMNTISNLSKLQREYDKFLKEERVVSFEKYLSNKCGSNIPEEYISGSFFGRGCNRISYSADDQGGWYVDTKEKRIRVNLTRKLSKYFWLSNWNFGDVLVKFNWGDQIPVEWTVGHRDNSGDTHSGKHGDRGAVEKPEQ